MLLRIVLFVCLCTLVFQQHCLGADQSWNDLMVLAHDNVHSRNFMEAQRLLEAALVRAEKFDESDPRLSASLRALAEVYLARKEFTKAEALYKRELKTFDGLGEHYPDTAHVWLGLGRISEEKGNYREAERYYGKLLGRKHPIHTEKDAVESRVIWRLARMYVKQKKFDEAERYYLKALSMEGSLNPVMDAEPIELVELANTFRANGRYDQAETYYRRVLKLCEKSTGQEPVEKAMGMFGLADALLNKPGVNRQAKSKEGETLMIGALAIFDRCYGPDSNYSAQVVKRLARFYFDGHDYDKCEAFCKRGLAIHEKLDPACAQIGGISSMLAKCYTDKGRFREAETCYKRALEIFGKLPDRRTQYEQHLHLYANLLRNTGRKKEADALLARTKSSP